MSARTTDEDEHGNNTSHTTQQICGTAHSTTQRPRTTRARRHSTARRLSTPWHSRAQHLMIQRQHTEHKRPSTTKAATLVSLVARRCSCNSPSDHAAARGLLPRTSHPFRLLLVGTAINHTVLRRPRVVHHLFLGSSFRLWPFLLLDVLYQKRLWRTTVRVTSAMIRILHFWLKLGRCAVLLCIPCSHVSVHARRCGVLSRRCFWVVVRRLRVSARCQAAVLVELVALSVAHVVLLARVCPTSDWQTPNSIVRLLTFFLLRNT